MDSLWVLFYGIIYDKCWKMGRICVLSPPKALRSLSLKEAQVREHKISPVGMTSHHIHTHKTRQTTSYLLQGYIHMLSKVGQGRYWRWSILWSVSSGCLPRNYGYKFHLQPLEVLSELLNHIKHPYSPSSPPTGYKSQGPSLGWSDEQKSITPTTQLNSQAPPPGLLHPHSVHQPSGQRVPHLVYVADRSCMPVPDLDLFPLTSNQLPVPHPPQRQEDPVDAEQDSPRVKSPCTFF